MDQKLLFLINQKWTNPALDSFMATASSLAAWAPLLVLIAVLVILFGEFKARTTLLALGLVVAVSDGLVCGALKRIVNRPRPRESLAGVRIVDLQPASLRFLSIFKPAAVSLSPAPATNPHGHSFPSSHTVNNFSAATVLTLFYRRRGWLYFLPAAIIAYSRIYVGAHWPVDVLLSAPLGICLGLVLVALVEWAWRTRAARWMPALHARHPSRLEAAA